MLLCLFELHPMLAVEILFHFLFLLVRVTADVVPGTPVY